MADTPDPDDGTGTLTGPTPSGGGGRAPVPIEPGGVLGERYDIGAPLGHGGSGTVFRATDRMLGEDVAVKILRPDHARERSWIKRLAREVKVARQIRHPNVCRVYELGHADGHWFITMELARGGSLRDVLREGAGRTLAERLGDAHAVCAGLAAIHAVGICHRDVTPQNVLRMSDGRLVLSDFGLAVQGHESTTFHGGTPHYLPPEVTLGERSDQRSDVWQLGMILHELLFEKRPDWTRRGEAVMVKLPVADDATPVLQELARLCADCLATNPEQRPATALAVAGRLAAAESARPRAWTTRAWLRAKALAHRRDLRIVAGVALVAMTTMGIARVVGRPAPCRAGLTRIEGLWDPARREVVRHAFASTGEPYAAQAFARVDAVVGGYVRGWLSTYTDACEATHVRGEQSPEMLDLRMSCLSARLEESRALVALFERADAKTVERSAAAVDALVPLQRCSDVRALRSKRAAPVDPALSARWEAMRPDVAELKALADSGQCERGATAARAVIEQLRPLGSSPPLAEALYHAAFLAGDCGRVDDAAASAREAVWVALEVGEDDLAAGAAAQLVGALGLVHPLDAQDGQGARLRESAAQWKRLAESIIARKGGDPKLQAWLLNDWGAVLHISGDAEGAMASVGQAVALKRRALGPAHADVARSLSNLSTIQTAVRRYEEAYASSAEAVRIFDAALGQAHPIMARALANQAEAALALKRYAEARELSQRAVRTFDRTNSAEVAFALLYLGRAHLAEGRPSDAVRVLERAVTVRSSARVPCTLQAEAELELARALWQEGTEHARGRATNVARAARSRCQGTDDGKGQLAAIDAWLRSVSREAARPEQRGRAALSPPPRDRRPSRP